MNKYEQKNERIQNFKLELASVNLYILRDTNKYDKTTKREIRNK